MLFRPAVFGMSENVSCELIKIDCSQPLYLAHAKENASEASAKHAGVGGGGEVGFASEAGKSSLPFCAGVQFSRDPIRAFNDRIKMRENGGL